MAFSPSLAHLARLSFLALLAAGCRPDFFTVDEACDDKVPGENGVDHLPAVQLTARTNCYRRVVKIRQANLEKKLQEVAENHMDYMVSNEIYLDLSYALGSEDTSLGGSTGANLFERMDHVDYVYDDPNGLGSWETYVWVNEADGALGSWLTGAAEFIDWSINEPYFREPLLQLSWSGSGFAQAEIEPGKLVQYWLIVYQYPSDERANKPVVYPRDGQLDVPTIYVNGDPRDSLEDGRSYGYPISVHVGARSPAGYNAGATNPYEIKLAQTSLKGPNGNLEFETIHPTIANGLILRYGAVVVPLEPFEPNAKYTFKTHLSWIDGEEDIEITFTADGSGGGGGEGEGGTNETARAPAFMPQVLHRPPGSFQPGRLVD